MPQRRSLKSTAVELVVFLAMAAIIGHLSVNFWEQFVLHSELTKIRSSLTVLKDTLYTIECAYENLQKDITYLSEIAEQNPDELWSPPKTKNNDQAYNKKIYQGYQVQTVSKHKAEKNVHAAPVTVDEATSNYKAYQAGKFNKNSTAATMIYADADTLAPDEEFLKKYYEQLRAKDHQNNRDFIYVIDKKDRLIPIRYRNTEDVGTITRYPLKSVGIGKSEDELRGISAHSHNQIQTADNRINRIHKCYEERDEFRYNRPINDPRRWKF